MKHVLVVLLAAFFASSGARPMQSKNKNAGTYTSSMSKAVKRRCWYRHRGSGAVNRRWP